MIQTHRWKKSIQTQTQNQSHQSKKAYDNAWQAKAIADLRDWMRASSDHGKTIHAWQSVYIRCGACLVAWRDWCAANPIDDLETWLDAAIAEIAKRRWV